MTDSSSPTALCDRYGVVFHNVTDRLRWYELCMESQPPQHDTSNIDSLSTLLPLDKIKNITTQMALEECTSLNNPRSIASDKWITKMHMENQLVTFDCFHIPDTVDN